MTETVQHVAFTVSGEWLADFARTRLEEGRWDAGLNLLIDSLEGLTHDQAIAILKGEATLTGDSKTGIDIIELPKDGEIATRIRERMDYMYASLFRHGDQIWKPYAGVSGWDVEDWHFSNKIGRHFKMVNVPDDKPGAARSLFYANNPDTDMLVRTREFMVNDAYINDILCEPFTGTVPFWYKLSTNDAVNHVEKLVKANGFKGWAGLEIRGAYIPAGPQDQAPFETIEQVAEEVKRIPVEEVDSMVKVAARQALEKVFALVGESFEGELNDYAALCSTEVEFERVVDQLHKHITDDEWALVDKYRKLFHDHQYRILGDRVRAQAEQLGGFMTLELFTYKDKKKVPYTPASIQVPRNPFLRWAVRHFNWADHGHQEPEWPTVAGSGHKMMGDDPNHTDWMIGAGVPLEQAYDLYDLYDDNSTPSFGAVVMHCANLMSFELVRQFSEHQFVVLCKNEQRIFSGDIVHPEPNERVAPGSIVIVPHAGPEYQLAMETANGIDPSTGRRGCVICDVGGPLAHLAVVGREFKCTVLMLPGATKMYRDFDSICIDMTDRTITNNRM